MNKKRYLLLSVVLSAALSASAQDVDTTRVRVGYTQGNLQTVAGAVDKVGENRMNRGFVNNSLDALSGQSAGVQVQTGGNQEAMISAVRVRGTTSLTGGNDPLVIIDGVSSDLSTLTTIYPADIESFTILKDASETAQYGSRGAAGVIQVQTKKGKGERFHISYDGTVGFESIYKNVEMLNADQFRRAAQQLGVSIMDYGHDTNLLPSVEVHQRRTTVPRWVFRTIRQSSATTAYATTLQSSTYRKRRLTTAYRSTSACSAHC